MSDQDLLQRIEKIERFLSNLGPLVHHAERLAQCERLLMHHELDIEKNTANVEALLEEYRGQKAQREPNESAALALYGGEQ